MMRFPKNNYIKSPLVDTMVIVTDIEQESMYIPAIAIIAVIHTVTDIIIMDAQDMAIAIIVAPDMVITAIVILIDTTAATIKDIIVGTIAIKQ